MTWPACCDAGASTCVHSHEFTMAVYGAVAPNGSADHTSSPCTAISDDARWRRRMSLRAAFALTIRSSPSRTTPNDFWMRRSASGPSLRVVQTACPSRTAIGHSSDGSCNWHQVSCWYSRLGASCRGRGTRCSCARSQVSRPTVSLAVGHRRQWRRARHPRGTLWELAVEDRVHLLGHRDNVGDLFAAADIFAMPSLWEGLPLALFEAMRAGKAIVASATSGIPEAIVAT